MKKFKDDFVQGDYWMSNKMGVVEILYTFSYSIDISVPSKNEVRIYDHRGQLTNKNIEDYDDYSLVYRITKESHPEYFL